MRNIAETKCEVKSSQTTIELRIASDELIMLAEAITGLNVKLKPILNDHIDSGISESMKDDEQLVPLAAEIRKLRYLITNSRFSIEDLIKRSEL